MLEPSPPPSIVQLCDAPRIYHVAGFLDPTEISALRAFAVPENLVAHGIATTQDGTGFSFEYPVDGDATIEAVRNRLDALIGLKNTVPLSMRYRRYSQGEAHPPHTDSYEIGGATLILTAMLVLQGPEEGGETLFPDAEGGPLRLSAEAGALLLWYGHRPDGRLDQRSLHEGLPVVRGEKITLTWFVYQDRRAAARDLVTGTTIAVAPARRFFCVTEAWLAATNDALRAACDSRNVEFIALEPERYVAGTTPLPAPGDALYRVGTSISCMRLEQLVYCPGVATFGGNPLFGCQNPWILHERAGIRVPRTEHLIPQNRDALHDAVARLGGFPMVVKVPGGEGGVGVIRVDSMASLLSIVDYIRDAPMLMEFFPHVAAYRLVVIGDRVVDVEERYPDATDFRTNAGNNWSASAVVVPPQAVEMALAASRAIGIAFGGADVLRNAAGELLLTEFNFPCYFADQQAASGVDISGLMLDWLFGEGMARARTAVA